MASPLCSRCRLAVALFCTSLAVALMGASTTLLPTATLVLFPFRVSDSVDPKQAAILVNQLDAALNALGGLKVVLGDPATPQSNYLRATQAAGGDYYLIGYVAPALNHQSPVIEQIVSARSGTAVWSNTAYLGPDTNIMTQASAVKIAVVSYASRGYAAILNATPAPLVVATKAPTPAPKRAGGRKRGMDNPPQNLPNEAYGFSSGPTTPPKIYASAAHPSRFVVLGVTATGLPKIVADYTQAAIISALTQGGQSAAQGDPVTTRFPRVQGPMICSDSGGGYLVFGTVALKVTPPQRNIPASWTDVSLTVDVINCRSQKFQQIGKPVKGGGTLWRTAVDKAARAAVPTLIKVTANAAAAT